MNSFTRIGLRSRFLLVLMIGLILPTLSVWGQNATITGQSVPCSGYAGTPAARTRHGRTWPLWNG